MPSALLIALVLATPPDPTWNPEPMGSLPSHEGMRQQDVANSFCNWIRVDDSGEGPALLQARAVRLRIHQAWLTSTPGNVVVGSRLESRVLVIEPEHAGAGLRKMLAGLRHGAEVRVAIREEVGEPLQGLWEKVPPEAQLHLRVRLEALEEL
jgi:hypothetical protein